MLALPNAGKNWERLGKNAVERTGRVEKSKEEIPCSKRSMYGYILLLLQALKAERLSSVFSPDGTLIPASAAPLVPGGTRVTEESAAHFMCFLMFFLSSSSRETSLLCCVCDFSIVFFTKVFRVWSCKSLCVSSFRFLIVQVYRNSTHLGKIHVRCIFSDCSVYSKNITGMFTGLPKP